jgi:hypothetical protein
MRVRWKPDVILIGISPTDKDIEQFFIYLLANDTFSWWWYLGLNSGLCTCEAGALPLEPRL